MEFINDTFLLKGKTAEKLYFDYAKDLPIIDYHCHLSPQEIAEDATYETIAKVWLKHDHYKWRAMRINGIDEKFITGDSSDWEKFEQYATILPSCIGNPLHHWSHLELKKYFDYNGHLTKDTAKEVWEITNEKIKVLSARKCMELAKVEVVCTTDDPIDDLAWHKQIKKDSTFQIKVFPTFRPDKALNIEKATFAEYILKLSETVGFEIKNISLLKNALANRIDYFHSMGCKLSDHAFTTIDCIPTDEEMANKIFEKALHGVCVCKNEEAAFKTHMLLWLAEQYTKLNWTMQLHFGVLRDVNKQIFTLLGPDSGADCSLGDTGAQTLANLLGLFTKYNCLPKTIVYSINPNDNFVIDVVNGCFPGSGIKSKIQHGSAWWFNDTKLGMENHMEMLASVGVLGTFIGMLTDSRSFLSYTRHDYFRRILCNYIGTLVDNGEYPKDFDLLKQLVQDISYYNAKNFFDF